MTSADYLFLNSPSLAELKLRGKRAVAETRIILEEMEQLASQVRHDAAALHRATTRFRFRP